VADSLAEPICVGAALPVEKRIERRLTASQTEFTIHRDPKLSLELIFLVMVLSRQMQQ
jgi:hypothetical protein